MCPRRVSPSGLLQGRSPDAGPGRAARYAARLFGQPDYFVHVAVADAEAFEAFQMSKLIGLPAVACTVSHQTMKRLKG